MPNRYEREIEEILRNLENQDSKTRPGQKARRKPENRTNVRTRPRSFPSLRFKMADWFLIIAILAALIGGGFAYSEGRSMATGILSILGAVCLLLVILSQFRIPTTRSTQSTRYGNVSPIRRGPLNSLTTRWNLFLLKLRYRRKRE